MNAIFFTTQGHKHNLIARNGTTLDELLKYYLRKMNRTEFIWSDKISFLFNGSQLEFGDQTTVETYFIPISHPKIVINSHDVPYYGN